MSISMRQLSRPDKSGNSRFEYTKILNMLISGLAPLRTKHPIYVKFLSGSATSIAPYVSNYSSGGIAAHVASYASNFHREAAWRLCGSICAKFLKQ
ncbi:MAG TPA: hypothetical protein PKK13_09730 [Spirochaetota bacterium]|nr:hypothetical protein [Spirochaetota bacterium]